MYTGKITVLLFILISQMANAESVKVSDNIKQFMEVYCLKCHDNDVTKGDVRFDDLSYEISDEGVAQRWQDALDVLNVNEMPPKKSKKQPSIEQKTAIIGELTETLQKSRQSFADTGGKIAMRYLNKREYANALKKLLGVDVNVSSLPQADSAEFDTFGSAQHFSPMHMDSFYKISRQALSEALGAKITKAKVKVTPGSLGYKKFINENKGWVVKLKELAALKGDREAQKKNGFATPELFEREFNSKTRLLATNEGYLKQPYADTGFVWGDPRYRSNRFKAKARTTLEKACRNEFEVKVGLLRKSTSTTYLEVKIESTEVDNVVYDRMYFPVTGTVDQPQIIEFFLNYSSEAYNKVSFGAFCEDKESSPIWVNTIKQTKVPYSDRLVGKQNIFGKEPFVIADDNHLKVVLKNFTSLAFRHKEADEVYLKKLEDYYKQALHLKNKNEALIDTLALVLSSPHFLYVNEYNESEKRTLISEKELAYRLSFFLHSSFPDERLLELASKNQLRSNLQSEIERLLKMPQADSFYTSFTHQWLHLIELAEVSAPKKSHIFNTIKSSIAREPVNFFKYIAQNNLSVRNFLDSDFIIADPVLADYYGLKYPSSKKNGAAFIKLPEDSLRGGVLGQAAILAMLSDGKTSAPIDRGAFVLRKLLNSPPPPPPANVPQADFKAKGLTVRQILEKHQEVPQCHSCHRKIDPLGFSMEAFDALGLVRDPKKNKDLETHGMMPDGKRVFKDFKGMKAFMLEDEDKFVTGLSQFLMSYGLGRSISFTDKEHIEAIVKNSKKSDHRFSSLIFEIVSSRPFNLK